MFPLYDNHVDNYYLVRRGPIVFFKQIHNNSSSLHTVQNRKRIEIMEIFVGHENYCLPTYIHKKEKRVFNLLKKLTVVVSFVFFCLVLAM